VLRTPRLDERGIRISTRELRQTQGIGNGIGSSRRQTSSETTPDLLCWTEDKINISSPHLWKSGSS